MKLTKLQRHTAYILMLEEGKKYEYRFGVCATWNGLFYDHTWKNLKYILPELFRKRQYAHTSLLEFWFKSSKSRKLAIEQCIKETA